MRQSATTPVTSTDPYSVIAEYYDLEHDKYEDDLPLIRQLVETVGDPVVELGCGSGRILAAIADLNMRMTGVDLSTAMLDRCRNRPSLRGARLGLIQADMTATGLHSGEYGIVVIGLNSLLHATTSDSQRAVLAESWRLLDPRGVLYLDLPNPLAGTFDTADHHVVREGSWKTTGGLQVTKYSSRTVDRVEQRAATTIWYDTVNQAGAITRTSMSFDLRYLFPAELQLMLELSGFVEWQIYGTYELDPFTDSSPRLIVTAEKTASS